MKNRAKGIIAALLLILMLPVTVLPASATTPSMSHYEGELAVGAINLDSESPVVLENMSLTYDIENLPEDYLDDTKFTAEGSRLTVKYTLRNPTDSEAVAKIALPFTNPIQKYIEIPPEAYEFKLNGEVAETVTRHTIGRYFHEEMHNYLIDGYAENGFFNLDTPVTKYTFKISGVDTETYYLAQFGIDLPGDDFKTAYYFDGDVNAWNNGIGYRVCGDVRVLDDGMIDVYAFGVPDISRLNWKFYENPSVRDNQTIDGSAELISQSSMTFSEFVFADYDPDQPISETDWYNAFVTQCDLSTNYGRPVIYLENIKEEGYGEIFTRWELLDIPLGAGESCEVEVGLPLFPSIGIITEPYTYDYYFSRFNNMTWAEGGKIDITVNTDLYMLSCGKDLGEPQKTDSGYRLSADSVGHYGEIFFTLCEVESPEYVDNGWGDFPDDFGSEGGNTVLAIIGSFIKVITYPLYLLYKLIVIIKEFLGSIF